MQEMRYLGSKTMLLEQIHQLTKGLENGIFCDPFGGIGTVGGFMKKNGYQVITGDLLNFAYYFQCSLIAFDEKMEFERLKRYLGIYTTKDLEMYLSLVRKQEGWLIEEYARKRRFFTVDNACHIQACIDCIGSWYGNSIIDEKERILLLASLINSFDKVANTAGTYYAYLKQFYRKAIKPFQFSLLQSVEGGVGYSYKMDAKDLVKQTKCDILYLDPPYNNRNYASYYHLPETISLGIEPKPVGKSGIYHSHNSRSVYNGRKATEAFEELINSADAQCIIFHYSDDGLIDIAAAKSILQKKGSRFEEHYLDCRGYTTTKESINCKHHIMKVSI